MQHYILQIDTATEVCSVSISLNGVTVDNIEADEPNLHASKLTIFIDELIKRNSLNYADLCAVCVSKGPGSYTGLRIGVSTAKGLCYALDIPLIAINTLDMMFLAYKDKVEKNTYYVPMLDARRMEVYLEIFDGSGNLMVPTEARIIDAHSFDMYLDDKLILFGSGASKLKQLFQHHTSVFIDSDFDHTSSLMSTQAYQKFRQMEVEDLVYFEPYYLKEFIATTPKKLL